MLYVRIRQQFNDPVVLTGRAMGMGCLIEEII
jgi:hypothetical protein